MFKERDPVRKNFVGLIKQIEKRGRDFKFLSQPQVKHLLNRPGDLAEVLEPDHAAAALERMKGAPQNGQDVDIVRLRFEQHDLFANGIENVVCFFQENLEQFGVDLFGARFCQLDSRR